MYATFFSWSGLIITLLAVIAILAIIFFTVRAIVRFIQRRRQQRSGPTHPGGL